MLEMLEMLEMPVQPDMGEKRRGEKDENPRGVDYGLWAMYELWAMGYGRPCVTPLKSPATVESSPLTHPLRPRTPPHPIWRARVSVPKTLDRKGCPCLRVSCVVACLVLLRPSSSSGHESTRCLSLSRARAVVKS